MTSEKISIKIINNTIYNIVGKIWLIIVTIIITPYIISKIGLEKYGLWVIIGIISNYLGLLDFGINTSFVKYIAQYYTNKDYLKINQVVNTGLVFYLSFTMIIFFIAIIFVDNILGLINLKSEYIAEAKIIFYIGIFLYCSAEVFNMFVVVQRGLQRMDLQTKVNIVVSVPNIIGIIYVLNSGYGLIGLVINQLVIMFISYIINVYLSYKIFPELKISIYMFDIKVFKELFNFGIKLYLSRIADLINTQFPKLLISNMLNIGYVTFYQLGTVILVRIKEVSMLLVSAITPAVAEMHVCNEEVKIKELYNRAYKYVVVISLPMICYSIIFADWIIKIWLGSGYEKTVLVMQILSLGYFFNLLIIPSANICSGVGRPDFQMKSLIFSSVINIVLSFLLIKKFGFFGLVWANFIALTLGFFVNNIITYKFFKLSLVQFFNNIFQKPVLAVIVSSIISYIFRKVMTMYFVYDRVFNFLFLLINIGTFIFVYLYILFKLKFFDLFDLEMLEKIPIFKDRNCFYRFKQRYF